jgi:serine/threonine protein phosphatase PrpC
MTRRPRKVIRRKPARRTAQRRVAKSRWIVCGTSRIGPGHVSAGMPNQDSWRTLRGATGLGAVVCDGVGSMPHADVGSRMACAAVAESLRLWRRRPKATQEHLIRLIHLTWAMRIGPHTLSDYATTCLFVVTEADGGLLLGQLGDGAILIEASDGKVSHFAPIDDTANGATTGLGAATDIAEWTMRRLPAGATRFVIVATDGVANDLDRDALDGFVDHIKTEILRHPARQHRRRLTRMLVEWPTEGHHDDKTIAVLWRSDAHGL